MKTYRVNEIFYSIQGEGRWTGRPMFFVRFSGCNLRCPWCDTQHDVGKDMTGLEILEELKRLRLEMGAPVGTAVCFTGGEPTLQVDEALTDEFRFLSGDGRVGALHLETNGTGRVVRSDLYECITVSPKGPYRPGMYPVVQAVEAEIGGHVDLKLVWDDAWDDGELAAMLLWGEQPFDRRYIQPLAKPDGTSTLNSAVSFVKQHPGWLLSIQAQKIFNWR